MKKLLALTALAITFAAPNAYAEHHEGGHDGPKHHKGAMMFDKFDLDNNGEVTREEFIAFHETKFTEMDADKSGVVTKDEAQAAMAKWKEKMKERREMKKEEAGEKPAE